MLDMFSNDDIDRTLRECHPELVSGSVDADFCKTDRFRISTRHTGSHEIFKILNQVQHDKNFGSLCKVRNDVIGEIHRNRHSERQRRISWLATQIKEILFMNIQQSTASPTAE